MAALASVPLKQSFLTVSIKEIFMEHLSLIYNELRALGITPNYKGYQQAVCAVQLSLEDEQRLTHICKERFATVHGMYVARTCKNSRGMN